MSDSRTEKLATFVTWSQAHITADEKGQAQIFLDRLMQAFGHAGSLDVGGSPEFRIREATEDGGGTTFADYVWKPVVLIEMKKRGANLAKLYRQAFDYGARTVPGRPRLYSNATFAIEPLPEECSEALQHAASIYHFVLDQLPENIKPVI